MNEHAYAKDNTGKQESEMDKTSGYHQRQGQKEIAGQEHREMNATKKTGM